MADGRTSHSSQPLRTLQAHRSEEWHTLCSLLEGEDWEAVLHSADTPCQEEKKQAPLHWQLEIVKF